MDDLENDVDVETLQAQVDLSLAHTQNLVSSWLSPKYASSSASSSRANQEKELEELMKRPARLGVGAPLPASTGVASHEAMKLKGKLTGKKRAREEDDVKVLDVSDEEGESRAGAIKKKARQDPFAPKSKKAGKASTPAPTNSPVKAAEKASAKVEAPQDAPSKPASKKAQKASVAQTPEPRDEPPAGDNAMDVDEASSTPSPSQAKPPTKPTADGLPLLNLDGPPPTSEGSPTAKKKRKRNKKKKKSTQ